LPQCAESYSFRTKPAEELYDTEKDPRELNNLADNPQYKVMLEELRKALNQWMKQINDKGSISETEMVRAWYAEGKQPQTAPVLFIPINEENFGTQVICQNGNFRFKGPVIVQMYCATQDASIGYKIGNDSHWQLYVRPVSLPKGKSILRAQAVRIGYKESEKTQVTFIII